MGKETLACQERQKESGLFNLKRRLKGGLLATYNHPRGTYGEDRARLVAGAPEQGNGQKLEHRKLHNFCVRQTYFTMGVIEQWNRL